MEQALASDSLPENAIVHFCFALGKACEDGGDYARAFAYFKRGNELRRMQEYYDPVNTDQIGERIRATFTPELVARLQGAGHAGVAPIFVIGLPRSGSTLIEQILASHSAVEATSELPEGGRLVRFIDRQRVGGKVYPEAVAAFTGQALVEIGRRYDEGTLRYRSGKPRFIDKMPNNFATVGLLALALPNARFINAERDPRDTCLSCYKQLFARGQPFTYDLTELGDYYLEYRRMIDHWHAVLPGRVLDVQIRVGGSGPRGPGAPAAGVLRPALGGRLPALLRDRTRRAHRQFRAGAPPDLWRRDRRLAPLRGRARAAPRRARPDPRKARLAAGFPANRFMGYPRPDRRHAILAGGRDVIGQFQPETGRGQATDDRDRDDPRQRPGDRSARAGRTRRGPRHRAQARGKTPGHPGVDPGDIPAHHRPCRPAGAGGLLAIRAEHVLHGPGAGRQQADLPRRRRHRSLVLLRHFGRDLPRRAAADPADADAGAAPRRHRAHRSAVRSPGHPVRRQRAVGHVAHHHQQAGCDPSCRSSPTRPSSRAATAT